MSTNLWEEMIYSTTIIHDKPQAFLLSKLKQGQYSNKLPPTNGLATKNQLKLKLKVKKATIFSPISWANKEPGHINAAQEALSKNIIRKDSMRHILIHSLTGFMRIKFTPWQVKTLKRSILLVIVDTVLSTSKDHILSKSEGLRDKTSSYSPQCLNKNDSIFFLFNY